MKKNTIQIWATAILFCFIITSLPISGATTDQNDGLYSNQTGYLTYYSEVSTSITPHFNESLKVGSNWTAGILTLTTHRAYLSFNTSELSATDVVLSATLYVYQRSTNETGNGASVDGGNMRAQVYSLDYGNTLDSGWGDWNQLWDPSSESQGVISNSSIDDTNGWKNLSLMPSSVSFSRSQYVIRAIGDREATSGAGEHFFTFDSWNDANPPYLHVLAINGDNVTVDYYFTDGATTNRSITTFPSEKTPYGYDREVLEYDIYSANESWQHLTTPPNMDYISCMPYANVTLMSGNTYNITETYDNTYYKVFFLKKPDIIDAELRISLYHSTIGEGFFFEKWKVYINEGQIYDPATASKIVTPTYTVEYGKNYTVTVLDFFNNQITNYSFFVGSYVVDIEIPIDVYTFATKNLRRDSTLMRIYFNGTGNPFTQQLSTDELYKMPIRQGSYMIVYTYLTTQSNLTTTNGTNIYYNLTFDGDYTAYVGQDLIKLDHITTQGTALTVNTINAYASPYAIISGANLPLAPVRLRSFDNAGLKDLWPFEGQGTRSIDAYTHTYAIYEADITAYYNGTSANLYDPKPSGGNVTITSDTLTISSEYNTNIMLNYTNGTNYLNYSTNPGIIVLNGQNLTIWANNSITSIRRVSFNKAGIFTWRIDTDSKEYTTTLALNNTSPFDYKNIYYYVPLAYKSDININETSIKDLTNDLYLVFGQHYSVSISGFHFSFNHLDSGEKISYEYKYKVKNATPTANSPLATKVYNYDIVTKNGQEYYVAKATINNPYAATYDGDITIVLDFDKAKYMDIQTLDVKMDGKAIFDSDIIPNGNTITIKADSVGRMGVGDTKTMEITFQTSDEPAQEIGIFTTWFKIGQFSISLWSFFTLVPMLLGAYAWLGANRKDQKMWALMAALSFSLLMIGTILHSMGAI